MVCILAALFTGVLIGRLTDDPQTTGRIYLNETAPPAALKMTPAPKKTQPHTGRSARESTAAVPRSRTTPKPAKSTPTNQVPGYTNYDPTQVIGDQSVQVVPGLASRVVALTNAARVKRGCRPLQVDARLTRSARTHSEEMARTGRFTHDSPDGSSPWDRMERAGYSNGAAENIGRGYSSADEAVRAWLDSRDRRQNILNCSVATIGVGVVSGAGDTWWTQDLGYP
ncbi:CAP domain-containing protein [Nonomuraea sediminis]|uniref:CAP domain-containing protein n=1 Tax=Nonomuraea sediminis TaxID=2835864 RepID=UPI001BDC5417|nr:CAP domain-containing protein [Nonomuraea sediminis]